MPLTKRDFIKFALQLSLITDDVARKEMTESHIDILRQTNPRFDAQRFRDYVEDKARKNKLGY